MVHGSTKLIRSEDVSVVIKTLAKHQCHFGIRGGGHGQFPLASSVESGVTINFGNMNSTTWNPETKLASVQPGSHWQAVYETLAPFGIVVAGARVAEVGVGGYLTGGGLSFHQSSHGMGCDNVANFEVVLASGEIVNANASSNPDLWKALKGSSGNLGLVTCFDMYSIEYADQTKPVVWGGTVRFPESSGREIADAMIDFTDNIHKDENSSTILAWAYDPERSTGPVISAAIFNTEARVKPAAFDGFYSVDGMSSDNTRVATLTEHTADLGFGLDAGYHDVWYTGAFQSDARPVKFAADRFAKLIQELEQVAPSPVSGLTTSLLFQPLSKSMTDKGIRNGGNVVGLDRFTARANGVLVLLIAAVKDAEPEKLIEPKLAKFMDDVDADSAALRLKWEWRYLNYASGMQDVVASYGTKVISKIRAVANKYDPQGVFQNLRASGFKIPRDITKDEL
ncbi:FAD binding domain-containing protein [Akanthomyces lecanii RCEF 1005]|uniref:FAD binding domain-containing protein n=1 Tax=Akanthomyces lecanii RCEF 1005 TaxID=1081108 RepID=A0A168F2H5_CORDF|nr:FAD binding domain-containing protein [Akanthomyces lecanii RCEF 1005]